MSEWQFVGYVLLGALVGSVFWAAFAIHEYRKALEENDEADK